MSHKKNKKEIFFLYSLQNFQLLTAQGHNTRDSSQYIVQFSLSFSLIISVIIVITKRSHLSVLQLCMESSVLGGAGRVSSSGRRAGARRRHVAPFPPLTCRRAVAGRSGGRGGSRFLEASRRAALRRRGTAHPSLRLRRRLLPPRARLLARAAWARARLLLFGARRVPGRCGAALADAGGPHREHPPRRDRAEIAPRSRRDQPSSAEL